MFDDTEMTAARAMEPIGGELTGVVHVALADVHGHPHEFTLLLDDEVVFVSDTLYFRESGAFVRFVWCVLLLAAAHRSRCIFVFFGRRRQWRD